MDESNHDKMTSGAYEALRTVFLGGHQESTDNKLLIELSKNISSRDDFVLGAFVAWKRPDDKTPEGLVLENDEVLFFSTVVDDAFKARAKKTLATIKSKNLFVSALLHKKGKERSKKVDIVHRCQPPCPPVNDGKWYCNNSLENLAAEFSEQPEKDIASEYMKVLEGSAPYHGEGYFPDPNKSYLVIYCPFLVPDGKPPGNFFGIYECVGEKQAGLLAHLAAIQHAGTMIYARRAMESKMGEILEHGRRSAIAAIMSRNMSHNIGSHVLSQISYTAMQDTEEMANLHAYLQRRMDLVARITSRNPDWGEPMWFFADLMRGFLSQTILLDTLVRDQGGWGKDAGKPIKFILFKGGKLVEIVPTKRTLGSDGTTGWFAEKTGVDDFLVSIPDGAIGAQAFYVFLESLMRNSAKYGKAKDSANTFDIHLEITEVDGKDFYEIGIWDTLSTCPDGDGLCKKLQKGIREALINENGEMAATSLGIAEMREACKFLIHPLDETNCVLPLDGINDKKCCGECPVQNGERPATGVDEDDKKKTAEKGPMPLWVECYKPDGHSSRFLRYRLHLAKPRMVGLVGNGIGLPDDAAKLGIAKLFCQEELTGAKGAYQFAVIMVENGEQQEICEWICQNHRFLPQRLLLVNDAGPNGCNIAPAGRAVWCARKDIFGENSFGGERLILNVYETWIKKKWLQEKNCVTLHVSYERKSIPEQWSKLDEILQLGFVAIKLWKKPSAENWGLDKEKGGCSDITVHYFNHHSGGDTHNNIPDSNVVRFRNGDLTCELLFAPPSSTFGLHYFFLGLIEAALTKVAVVDERVALWVLEPEKISVGKKRADDAKKQNVCIVFKYANEFLTPAIKIRSTKSEAQNNGGYGSSTLNYNVKMFDSFDSVEADLLVLHVGVVENTENGAAMMESENAPVVVMMSGRGGLKERTAGNMPFIEYSAIRQCFSHTGNISKYHLVKSLRSAKANK